MPMRLNTRDDGREREAWRQRSSLRPRFSVRALLALLAICGFVFAIVAHRIHSYNAAIRRVKQLGGAIQYSHEFEVSGGVRTQNGRKPLPGNWLSRAVLEDAGGEPVRLAIGGKIQDMDLYHLKGLRSLFYIYGDMSEITDQGLSYLSEISTLEKINLTDNDSITDAGGVYLSNLHGLTELRLGGTRIGGDFLRKMRIHEKRNLEFLDLRDTLIGDADLPLLADLPNLRILGLFGTSVTDKGIDALVSLPGYPSICLLDTPVTENAKKALMRRNNRLDVY